MNPTIRLGALSKWQPLPWKDHVQTTGQSDAPCPVSHMHKAKKRSSVYSEKRHTLFVIIFNLRVLIIVVLVRLGHVDTSFGVRFGLWGSVYVYERNCYPLMPKEGR